jgi:hypothetical protein
MDQLGPTVMQHLPFVITHKGAMERSVFNYINSEVAKGNSFSSIAATMKETQMEQYNDMLHQYVATAALIRIGCGLQLQRPDKSPSTSRLWMTSPRTSTWR